MILSSIAGRATPQATRSDYVRDWLSGSDTDALTSDSGQPILPETALRVAVIYRGINVLAHAISSPPLNVYERTAKGKRAVDDSNNSSYRLLHTRPNTWMTSFRWRHLTMVRTLLHGESFNQLLPGPGGISQLIPLEPATTRVVEQLGDGKLLYVTRPLTKAGYGPERRLVQDEVLHIRGLSLDGKRGVPLMEVAKNAVGLALAAEKHGSMFLKNGSRFAGILKTAADMDDDTRKENEESWRRAYGGANQSGTVPVLSGGLDYQSISANNRDSQWLEARTFQVEELLRFLGVPGVLVGYSDKTSTFASAEQFFLSFVKDTVQPWAENIAAELNFSVVLDPERYFAEFDLDGLLKGDIKTRYQAHQQAILSGWKNRNEVRREENYNPGPPELDEFLEPTNMAPAGSQDDGGQEPPPSPSGRKAPPQNATAPAPAPEPRRDDTRSIELAQRYALDAAGRVVRREIAAITGRNGGGLAQKYAKDQVAYEREVRKFYGEHEAFVVETMHVSAATAHAYCDRQEVALYTLGAAVVETWEREAVPALAAQALAEIGIALPQQTVVNVHNHLPAPSVSVAAPTVNVAAPHVNVEAPNVNVAPPTVNVAAPTIENRIEGAIVNVEAQPPAEPTPVIVQNHVHVPEPRPLKIERGRPGVPLGPITGISPK